MNQVAAIVHRIVDEHLGAANKNAGEAFPEIIGIPLSKITFSRSPASAEIVVFAIAGEPKP